MNREKSIIVYYLNADNIRRCTIAEEIKYFQESIDKKTGTEDFINIVIPVFDQETRVDCINPRIMSGVQYETLKEKLEIIQHDLTTLIMAQLDVLGENIEFEKLT